MPNNILKSWSDKYKISLSKLEGYWDEAVDIAEETFGKSKKEFKDKEYKYVMGVVKNMANIKESTDKKSLVESFLYSNKTAKQFIEEATLSSVITADNPIEYRSDDEIEEELEDEFYDDAIDYSTMPADLQQNEFDDIIDDESDEECETTNYMNVPYSDDIFIDREAIVNDFPIEDESYYESTKKVNKMTKV